MKMAVDYGLVLLQIILILSHQIKESEALMCPDQCGEIYGIRYPLGIGEGCYFDKSFEVVCNNSAGSKKAFLKSINLELSSSISYSGSPFNDLQFISYLSNNSPYIAVNVSVISLNSSIGNADSKGIDLTGTPFSFPQRDNRFIAIGCDNQKNDSSNSTIPSGCRSICTCSPSQNTGCCDMLCNMPINSTRVFDANTLYSQSISSQECRSVSMVLERWLFSNYLVTPNVLKNIEDVPVQLEWGKPRGSCIEEYNSDTASCNLDGNCLVQLGSGYFCVCRSSSGPYPKICEGSLICNTTSGYNCSECPRRYYPDSISNQELECYSITLNSEGFRKNSRDKFIIIGGISGGLGMLFLLTGAWMLCKYDKRRREIKLKKKFFRKNGGLLLQQELSSNEGNIEKTKLFTSKELENATDNFNTNRILGKGGQGTVYKGMLTDGKIVAVKKSKAMDERKVDEFINEVVILSQINHRNVVKLLGCCLETEVPLLVYEFIPNGTLFQLIHDQSEEFPITWEMRLRIAVEVSGALSYLHSAASISIYHRDIKSMNILLDDKYRSKVSDFGASKSMGVDQTHMTTRVQGTFGYLDPEYFRSSQFTEKSDVYSFGVVLVELLTGQRPIRLINSEDQNRSLSAYFLCAMEEDRLNEILDANVMSEDGNKDEIVTVAKLAKRCLNLKGKYRPTMREVAVELAGIKGCNGDSNIVQERLEQNDCVDGDIAVDFQTVDPS